MSKHEMLYIALAIIAVVVIIGLVIYAGRRRSSRLQNTFGPEYDRTIESTGDRREAERELGGRLERRKGLTIVDLDPARRDQYMKSWLQLQAAFVDAPRQSVHQADALVTQVMSERGYPMTEFDQRVADISVDHPQEVESYRAAHTISIASDQNRASTEDLRQAMTHYRALFERLLGGVPRGSGEPARDVEPVRSGAPSGVDSIGREAAGYDAGRRYEEDRQ